MAAGGEQVLASVVIEVINSVAPSGLRERGVRHSARKSNLLEAHLAQVAKQRHRLVEQCSLEDIRQAVVVDVPAVYAHPGDGRAVFCEGNAFFDGGFFERTVVLVQEQVVRKRVVRNEQIRPAVTVEVGRGDCHPLADAPANPRGGGHVCKRSVAIVVEQGIGHAGVRAWVAIVRQAAFLANRLGLRIPLHVIHDE